MSEAQQGVAVGERTLAVLAAAVNGARFVDVLAETGLAKATVHRILHQLVSLGYLVRDADENFVAGPRMIGLAVRALDGHDVAAIAHPIVVELAGIVDCTVHVGVEANDEVVYLLRQDASRPYRMRSRVGSSMPMHSSAMGKAILSSWPVDRVEAYAARTGLPQRTDRTIVELPALLDELAAVREKGYALDLGENEVGTVCVAAAFANPFGQITHALSISTIELERPGNSIAELSESAMHAASQISRKLRQ